MTASDGQRLQRLVEAIVAIRESDISSVTAALAALVRAVRVDVPFADYAGIVAVSPRSERAAAITDDPAVVALDAIERRHGEGPGWHAALHRNSCIIDDIAADRRWPVFARETLAATPIRSAAALPIHLDRLALGALVFYADRPKAFTADDLATASLYATLTATAWSAVVREDQLHRALSSRDVIGQAKGMLMERYNISDPEAFDLLRRLSSTSNIRLRDLAERLISARHLPGAP
ncbi:GAF and ANTAR domain-containing protein [Mycolicibacterium sp. Dal123E01]|uniref:GAF and ANTAR domain-containing protein n=1 Tax=Mycolicibacterium sp. Dal123E01 TaxID=3457578 RepID=UPI00403E8DB2